MHDDLVAPFGQGQGQRRDVHVLPAGVHTAEGRQRAGVLRHQGDPHGTLSFTASSAGMRRCTASTTCSPPIEVRHG
ncbi:hypothetical protein GCM10027612_73820 [Microbispora bryophytorum subsp. camponoti]